MIHVKLPYAITRLLIMLTLVFLATALFSQKTTFKVGVKGGISRYDYGIKELDITQPETFKINLEEEKFGFHAGITLQLKVNKFILQPEFLFNSMKVNYKISNYPGSLPETLLGETFRDLDIPLMIGFKSGALRLNAGPVGHIHLQSVSELFKLDSYSENFKKLQWGWQAGMGIDFWKITMDVRYEGNFYKFGNHIQFGDVTYQFSSEPARLIGSLGFQF